jgi:hypothetical protein
MTHASSVLIALGATLAVVVLVAVVVIIVSRRSHLRAWRFGVFYESEDRRSDP